MPISSLVLKKFRNLDVDVELSPSANFIFGDNAVGKSNFLDSIHYLYLGKSFRPYSDGLEINWHTDTEFGSISASLQEEVNEHKIVFSKSTSGVTKKFFISSNSTTKSRFIRDKYLILFSPHLLNIITGTPEDRRLDMDDFLCQLDFKYEKVLSKYKSVVKNRNRVLQKFLSSGKQDKNEIYFWNNHLIELGTFIIEMRLALIRKLDPIMDESAKLLFSTSGDFKIEYISKYSGEQSVSEYLKEKVENNLDKEIFAGRTLYGPHRDDFDVLLDGKSLKLYGSRGQQRIASLILKFAQYLHLKKTVKQPVIILLDDIFSELDKTNSEKLQDFFKNIDTQIFIATANPSEIMNTGWPGKKEINLSIRE